MVHTYNLLCGLVEFRQQVGGRQLRVRGRHRRLELRARLLPLLLLLPRRRRGRQSRDHGTERGTVCIFLAWWLQAAATEQVRLDTCVSGSRHAHKSASFATSDSRQTHVKRGASHRFLLSGFSNRVMRPSMIGSSYAGSPRATRSAFHAVHCCGAASQ